MGIMRWCAPAHGAGCSLSPFVRDGAGEGAATAHGMVDRVSPGFFRASGISLRSGREFSWQDTAQNPQVAIITEPLAARLFPGADAVGERIQMLGRPQSYTIVGVAGDAAPGDPRIRNIPLIYRPTLQESFQNTPAVLLRGTTDAGLLAAVRGVLRVAGRHDVSALRTIEEQTDRFLIQERVLSGLTTAFGILGMLVGALGLYAVLAYGVTRRTREWGLRLALGASRRSVLGLVVREGLVMVTIGVALGLPLALAAGHAARSLLFSVSPHEPMVLSAVAVLLVCVGVSAGVIPAARAVRTQPGEALRHE